VPGEAVAGAALAGFGAGYYGAQAVTWAWDSLFGGKETGGDTVGPTDSGFCSLYRMSTLAPVNGIGGAHLVAACNGQPAGTQLLDLNIGCSGDMLPLVAPNKYEGDMRSTGGCGYGYPAGAAAFGIYARKADGTYLGGVGMSGPMNDAPATAPYHELRTVTNCANGAVVTAYSVPFRETDPAPTVPAATCPAGVLPTSLTVREGDATGQGGTRGYDWTAPPGWTSTTDPLRDCYPGGSAAPCALHLLKVVGSSFQPCTDASVDCSAYTAASTAATYQCRWGAHIVGTDQCAALVGVYTAPTPGGTTTSPVPGTVGVGTPSTVTNPDGSTTTTTIQQLPDGTLQRVTDTTFPDGARTVTTLPVDVNGNPTGSPTTVNFPATRPTTEPGATEDGCAFGLKPWLWPYRAFTCALVPSAAAKAEISTDTSTLTGAIPFGYVGQIKAAVDSAGADAGGSCNTGPTFTVTGYSFQPLNLCSGPLYDALHPLRPFLTAAMWLAILAPVGLWLFRQSLPVVGGGESV
jgi:hypothetical protein